MKEDVGQIPFPEDKKKRIIEEARVNLLGLFQEVKDTFGRENAQIGISTLGRDKEKRAVLSFGTVNSEEGSLEVVTVWPIFGEWNADDKLLLIAKRTDTEDWNLLKFYIISIQGLRVNVYPEFPTNVENTKRAVGITRDVLGSRENRAKREITIEQTIGFLDEWQSKSV